MLEWFPNYPLAKFPSTCCLGYSGAVASISIYMLYFTGCFIKTNRVGHLVFHITFSEGILTCKYELVGDQLTYRRFLRLKGYLPLSYIEEFREVWKFAGFFLTGEVSANYLSNFKWRN